MGAVVTVTLLRRRRRETLPLGPSGPPTGA
jgi:hypothetical protein